MRSRIYVSQADADAFLDKRSTNRGSVTYRSAERIVLLRHRNMPLLPKTIIYRAALAMRGNAVSQRSNIYTKSAKDKVGAMVSLAK